MITDEMIAHESSPSSPFERWASRVEKILGHSLDGDQSADGYSMDDAVDHFDSGMSSRNYAQRVIDTKAHMARRDYGFAVKMAEERLRAVTKGGR